MYGEACTSSAIGQQASQQVTRLEFPSVSGGNIWV